MINQYIKNIFWNKPTEKLGWGFAIIISMLVTSPMAVDALSSTLKYSFENDMLLSGSIMVLAGFWLYGLLIHFAVMSLVWGARELCQQMGWGFDHVVITVKEVLSGRKPSEEKKKDEEKF